MRSLSKIKTLSLLVFLVIMWGINWPLSKYALHFCPPILFAGIRTLLAGLLLLIYALPNYKKFKFKQNWSAYLISAVLNIIIFYGLQTIGLKFMPAGLFSAIVFIQPILLGVFSWLWLGEAMYGLKIIGLILGFLGVAAISINGVLGHLSVIGILLALGTAFGWGLGTVYVKKQGAKVDSIWMVTSQLLIGGVLLSGVGSLTETWSDITWNLTFVSLLAFISIFVIAIGWLVFFTLVGAGEASIVGSYTFIIPLISVAASALFLHEAITLNLLGGLVLVIISILCVNIKPKSLQKKALDR
ncbi:DMT family transporter [Pullulanibacillus sp. KACC 23026]|uniref:DMT family transporter n=1 Tax=Pullulanibacillus sp. KACC 23026 TaxID=3028315 RepID=UPI0023B0440F|nr:DMT family transporter [Pullulanibacillus sp. KACC 23026]WEG14817.1 DMT family transporter [Pullulanibacillus sp. KACC 23026]